MASQGPLTGTTASVPTGVGNDYDWDFPTNAAVDDGGIARADLSCTGAWSGRSFYLDSTGHSFTIPGNATITGILVEVKKYAGSMNSVLYDATLRLLKAGAVSGADKASGSYWSGMPGYTLYGGPLDMWGTTWTPAQVNAATFGIRLQAADAGCDADIIPPDNEHMAQVDAMRITVTYTEPPPSVAVADRGCRPAMCRALMLP